MTCKEEQNSRIGIRNVLDPDAIILQKPNLLSLGLSLLDRLGDLECERDPDFDRDLDLELELFERDLEWLCEREERLLERDEDDDDDELLSLRRFFLLGGEPDSDLERLKTDEVKKK